jgi:hypothetical protein
MKIYNMKRISLFLQTFPEHYQLCACHADITYIYTRTSCKNITITELNYLKKLMLLVLSIKYRQNKYS